MKRNRLFYIEMFTLAVVYIFIVVSVLVLDIGVRINRSESLPHHLYVSKKIGRIDKGMYVSIEHPKTSISVGKQIVGLPKDRISISDNRIFINEREFGQLKKVSESGKEYHPIKSGIIPDGHVFLFASHEGSFDSRYEEFGLVPIEWIKEELWPLF